MTAAKTHEAARALDGKLILALSMFGLAMGVVGQIVGIVSGVVLGLFSLAASKLVRRADSPGVLRG